MPARGFSIISSYLVHFVRLLPFSIPIKGAGCVELVTNAEKNRNIRRSVIDGNQERQRESYDPAPAASTPPNRLFGFRNGGCTSGQMTAIRAPGATAMAL